MQSVPYNIMHYSELSEALRKLGGHMQYHLRLDTDVVVNINPILKTLKMN